MAKFDANFKDKMLNFSLAKISIYTVYRKKGIYDISMIYIQLVVNEYGVH